MTPWWILNSERVQRERQAIVNLLGQDWISGGAWNLDDGRLCVDVLLHVHQRTFACRLTYPQLFPSSPATVTPRESQERWSSHQYGASGELCLEWGPDNWHPEVSGAALLESAYRLLQGEANIRAKGEEPPVPNRHATSLGQNFRTKIYRFLLSPAAQQVLACMPNEPAPATFRLFIESGYLVGYLDTLDMLGQEETWRNPDIPTAVLDEGMVARGFVISTDQPGGMSGKFSAADLAAYLSRTGHASLDTGDHFLTAFLWGHRDGSLSWMLRIGELGKDAYFAERLPLRVVDPTLRLPSDLKAIHERRVAILGLGSAGSKIALSLGRSGVRKFLLVDDDILFPENLVRNALDWRGVGFHKVDATAAALHRLAIDMEIMVCRRRMGGQEASASAAAVDQEIANCDLAIEATASSQSFNRASHVTQQANVPLVWLEIFAGGIGGFMARSRPENDPDPYAMRLQLDQWMNKQDAPVPKVVTDYTARGADGVPLVASDAAVTAIAAHTTEFALDTLAARNPSAYPANVYLIGLRQAWIFQQPLDIRPLILERSIVPTTQETEPAIIHEHSEFLKGLLPSDEDDDSTST